ncbi:hypothetical protein SORBI_3003G431301 [Sorghum bicolor]|uniref:Uncharacterized protein n=1 Tax=Sorghum bicolor TaxID=4558 RepID=A0A1W0W1J3_SORBI|nr:hypothetical protein SORBI_3003G431301 [Sorghum bicolor]
MAVGIGHERVVEHRDMTPAGTSTNTTTSPWARRTREQRTAASTRSLDIRPGMGRPGRPIRVGTCRGLYHIRVGCPTPRSFIHTTLLCQAIARCLFPRDSDPSYAELPEEHYTFRVLNRLHHKVLTPLRRILRLPQVYMTSSRRWTDLPYANVAMQRYKAHADTMATRRFTRFEARGKVVKLTGTAALPKTERQWCRLVDSLRDKNLLSNCMVFCDMSKSMDGTPMEVSAALGLLISQLGEYPWEGRVITLNNDDDDEEPQITKIRGKTLLGKLSFLHKMQSDDDLSIDFRALFNYMYEYILDKAKKLKLDQDNMIRSVFVFTDKELDEAWVSPWTQDYRVFCRRFKEAAVTSRLPGVMILKGFSNNLLKSFLENNGVVYPEDEMSSALDRDEFKNLSLFD